MAFRIVTDDPDPRGVMARAAISNRVCMMGCDMFDVAVVLLQAMGMLMK